MDFTAIVNSQPVVLLNAATRGYALYGIGAMIVEVVNGKADVQYATLGDLDWRELGALSDAVRRNIEDYDPARECIVLVRELERPSEISLFRIGIGVQNLLIDDFAVESTSKTGKSLKTA